jgi:hypothetical protein
MKVPDTGVKSKLPQVKNELFNPKGTKSANTAAQSRESSQPTAERGSSGSSEQELESIHTISGEYHMLHLNYCLKRGRAKLLHTFLSIYCKVSEF